MCIAHVATTTGIIEFVSVLVTLTIVVVIL